MPGDHASGDERGDPAPIGDKRKFTAFLVGAGRAEPSVTKGTYAARIMCILESEADGCKVLPDVGRRSGGWCRKQFLKSATKAGESSWRFFKATYASHIQCNEDQQWVKIRTPTLTTTHRE